MNEDVKTPLLDELEKGEWPSFVTQIKQAAKKHKGAEDLLKQLEISYEDKIGHWKPGGIVGVKGYGGGVVGRYSKLGDKFPNVKEFHTMRVNQPAGFFYTTEKLRQLCDVWDKYGSGLLNMHGSTGDIILLGTTTANLQPCFDELSDYGYDLGGSGSDLRTPSCCVGPARCEHACIDSLDIIREITQHYQDSLHRPAWPYKFKIKVSACPNDCCAAVARSDFAIIGVWRDEIRVDQKAVKDYVDNGFDIFRTVIRQCPTWALDYNTETKELCVNNDECVHCMHCINKMPKALRVGKEKGAAILVGGKVPIVKGAQLGSVIVPFMKLAAPYDELKALLDKVVEYWDERAKNRERLGELIDRFGMSDFLKHIGIDPIAQMVKEPRSNPYIYWRSEEVEKHG